MRNPEFGPKSEPRKKEETIEEKAKLPEIEIEEKKPIKKETIQKLKEAVKVLGTTSSKKIDQSEYVKYYARFIRHKEEWGYKGWKDFLAKEIAKTKEITKDAKEIAKDGWNALLEKYEGIIEHIDIDAFVEHFLQKKYPDRKAEVEKNVVETLKS